MQLVFTFEQVLLKLSLSLLFWHVLVEGKYNFIKLNAQWVNSSTWNTTSIILLQPGTLQFERPGNLLFGHFVLQAPI